MIFGEQILSPLACFLTQRFTVFVHWMIFFFFFTKTQRWKSWSLFHPWPLIPLISKYLFTFLSSQRWIQWVDICPGLSAINSNSCNISSSKTAILWLLHIIFVLLFGSVSLVSPESALTCAEWSSRISSPVFYFSHTLLHSTTGDILSLSLQLILFQSSRVTQWSLIKFCKMITNFQMQITCCRHKFCTHYIPPPWFKGWLSERGEGRPPKIISRPGFPHRIQSVWECMAHRCRDSDDIGWCWCMLVVNITESLLGN